MALKNEAPEQHSTHERQRGGNTPAVGEAHGQPKAEKVHESKRFSKEVVAKPRKSAK